MERAPGSLEKALEICETLSGAARGMSLREVARAVGHPPSTVHRLLNVLKRRGYVRQDEETARYSLTLKMLDLSFRLMGRSELRLHAYPVIREHVLSTGQRAFFAVPGAGEVTYVWSTGLDAVATYTAYGREMPGHCAIFFGAEATRRLSCVRLSHPRDVAQPETIAVRLGAISNAPDAQRMLCTCAPVSDYTGKEVARVGVFAHGVDEGTFGSTAPRTAWELARLISLRLGHLPAAAAMAV